MLISTVTLTNTVMIQYIYIKIHDTRGVYLFVMPFLLGNPSCRAPTRAHCCIVEPAPFFVCSFGKAPAKVSTLLRADNAHSQMQRHTRLQHAFNMSSVESVVNCGYQRCVVGCRAYHNVLITSVSDQHAMLGSLVVKPRHGLKLSKHAVAMIHQAAGASSSEDLKLVRECIDFGLRVVEMGSNSNASRAGRDVNALRSRAEAEKTGVKDTDLIVGIHFPGSAQPTIRRFAYSKIPAAQPMQHMQHQHVQPSDCRLARNLECRKSRLKPVFDSPF